MKATDHKKLPDFCFGCDAEGADIWVEKSVEVEQQFRGETFRVVMTLPVCLRCGFKHAQEGQADFLAGATADLYREKHGLLTSAEMVRRRKKLLMTQREFAKFLGVGVASVKRWERGAVQDRSSDQLIRSLTGDPKVSFLREKALGHRAGKTLGADGLQAPGGVMGRGEQVNYTGGALLSSIPQEVWSSSNPWAPGETLDACVRSA